MHPQQKAAWFNLIVFGGSAALYLVTVPLLSWGLHRPWSDVAVPAMAVFGFCGLGGFTNLFFRPRHKGQIVMDERDRSLAVRAWQAGMGVFWGVFVLGCMGFWGFVRYVHGLQRVTVPVDLFPWMVFAAMIIFSVTQSLATLHYYGWRSNDASER